MFKKSFVRWKTSNHKWKSKTEFTTTKLWLPPTWRRSTNKCYLMEYFNSLAASQYFISYYNQPVRNRQSLTVQWLFKQQLLLECHHWQCIAKGAINKRTLILKREAERIRLKTAIQILNVYAKKHWRVYICIQVVVSIATTTLQEILSIKIIEKK